MRFVILNVMLMILFLATIGSLCASVLSMMGKDVNPPDTPLLWLMAAWIFLQVGDGFLSALAGSD